ncbi:MAG TPA: condensation domain-containing protein, partial [Herpetosiphonaceae bacterium]
VKIRGYRVELGEVEAALDTHPQVREVVVLARPHGGTTRLVAYVVLDGAMPSLSAWRQFLQAQLPEYMLPQVFVRLDAIPLAPHGKIDRAALPLPDVEPTRESAYAAPSSPLEAQLAAIWSQVLGVPTVGVHDNFFLLGGDSIRSIQIISRANQAGIRITPRQMFLHQTIAELSGVVTAPETLTVDQGPVRGNVPLTPIQRWFFEQQLLDQDHYNQSILLKLHRRLTPALLEQAIKQLLAHHDALRMRFHPTDQGWQQINQDLETTVPFTRVDLSMVPVEQQRAAIEAAAAEIQASLNLQTGPILRAVLFDLGAHLLGRLLIVIHHLVIDGVSWNILLEDLQTACDQLEQGRQIALPSKTTSFKQWAERLSEYAQTPEVQAELEYWHGAIPGQASPLPIDMAAGSNTEGSTAKVRTAIDAAQTRLLLQHVPAAYRTQINDVLLTALALAYQRWTGSPSLLVDLEGHGREELFSDVDLSRTVGWFTTAFPVHLHLGSSLHPGASLKAIKEQLRQIPRRGIGYGLLRYLAQEQALDERLSAKPAAQIIFNYLGQFDGVLPEDALFELAPEATGPARGPENARQHLIEVTGEVVDGQLRVVWTYSRHFHGHETIVALAEHFLATLDEIINHCVSPDAGGYTPSDFPLARLNQQQIDQLVMGRRTIADIYPLSPLQQGLLFHSLYNPESSLYLDQLTYELRGALDVAAFRKAWQEAIDTHAILRTSFHWQGLADPLQLVHQRVEAPFQTYDWSHLPAERQQTQLAQLLAADYQQPLDLASAPLMRLTLIRLDPATYRLIWSFHHLLLDGWSLHLLLQDVFRAYRALAQGATPQLERGQPFKEYIAWLQRQNMQQAEQFWRQMLRGFSRATPLGLDRLLDPAASQEVETAHQTIYLSAEASNTLYGFVKQQQLTLNTLFQGAWALLLSRYSNSDDIVFGTTVSGRPPELPGIERTVGVFINTLPARLRVADDQSLIAWLEQIQMQQVELRQYEYSPLVHVQGWSEVPRGQPLFESLLVFENYPEDSTPGEKADKLVFRQVGAAEQSSYPLTLIVAPGSRLRIQLMYDRRRFDNDTATMIIGHLQTLIETALTTPAGRIAELSFLTEAERHNLIVAWNATAISRHDQQYAHVRFAEQAARTPNDIALVYRQTRLSYGELNSRANQLAHYLRGLGTATRVALFLDRSPDLALSVLATLKAGGTCVVLHPADPQSYLAAILEDAQPDLILTFDALHSRLPQWSGKRQPRIIALDAERATIAQQPSVNPHSLTLDEQPASISYAAGKGIAISHRALGQRLLYLQQTFPLAATDAVLHSADPATDAAIWELLWPLTEGARAVIAAAGDETPAAIRQSIAEHEVTVLPVLPTTLAGLLHEQPAQQALRSLHLVLCGGEQLAQRIVDDFYRVAAAQLYHYYMPPETAGFVHQLCEPEALSAVVPIGRPVASAYILSQSRQLVPISVSGELWLSDTSLARGDAHDPACFSADPFAPVAGMWMFQTGDSARRLSDGTIELAQAGTRQAWIAGRRVDLDAVAQVITESPAVAECVVRVRHSVERGPEIVAYVVATTALGSAQLAQYVAERLPAAIAPRIYIPLTQLPLDATGEIDEQALAELVAVDPELIDRWETTLQQLPDVDQAAVVLQEPVPDSPLLHLSEVFEHWRSLSGQLQVASTSTPRAAPALSPELLGRPSLSDGGPLVLPPDSPTTLSAALLRAARDHAQNGVVYIQNDRSELFRSYPALLEEAEQVLTGLRSLGLQPQDKVIFQLDLNQDFVPVFWSCILGGFVPVPISIAPTYDQPNSTLSKLANAWQLLDRPVIVTTQRLAPALRSVHQLLGGDPFQVAEVEELRANAPDRRWHPSEPEDLTLILLTSGSTGMPKGVQLRHRNILSQGAGTMLMNDFSSRDVSLNWMPLDHVGGIVMFHLRDVFLCCQQIHAPTDLVLRDPLLWLDWIERYRATITWAPNFAYGLINDQADEIERRSWDLSSMRFILNGGEAVVARTGLRFLERLSVHGLPVSAMHPAWGMSETSSGVTYSWRFTELTEDATFVEVGAPIPGIAIRIVDAQNQVVPEGTIGRLQVSGRTVTGGYYRNAALNEQVFHDGRWFNTGDLGFLKDGRLTITGREQDVIIINGVNYYSHEIEAVVEEVAGVAVSFTAACAVRQQGSDTDLLTIFFSPEQPDETFIQAVMKEIRGRVTKDVGVNPSYLIPLEKEVIPKTAIGKIQRSQLKDRFVAGEFDAILKQIDVLSGNANTLPDWFYRPVWRRKAGITTDAKTHGATLVLLDAHGLGEQICAALEQQQSPAIGVVIGSTFARIDERRYQLDPSQPDHYRRLLAALAADRMPLSAVIHLWTFATAATLDTAALDRAQTLGSYSLLLLAQALTEQASAQPVRLLVVSSDSQPVRSRDQLAPEHAPMLGLLKTLAQELPWLHCRHLDLPSSYSARDIPHVLRELRIADPDVEVAYRDQQRLVSRLEHVDVTQRARSLPFKSGGIYLLTGGLGGIGEQLAAYLLKQYGARLL